MVGIDDITPDAKSHSGISGIAQELLCLVVGELLQKQHRQQIKQTKGEGHQGMFHAFGDKVDDIDAKGKQKKQHKQQQPGAVLFDFGGKNPKERGGSQQQKCHIGKANKAGTESLWVPPFLNNI